MTRAIIFRGKHFYVIELMDPADCGKSLKQQAAENAELNPGTVRVELYDGTVLWQLQ